MSWFPSMRVREHPAPSGALRHEHQRSCAGVDRRQGAPSTIRCIETLLVDATITRSYVRQGAPSTIRCIETYSETSSRRARNSVREHPAPSGALRRIKIVTRVLHVDLNVREHPAPSGALRLGARPAHGHGATGQGAPSTIRCIETARVSLHAHASFPGRGAPSTIRCIETCPTCRRAAS